MAQFEAVPLVFLPNFHKSDIRIPPNPVRESFYRGLLELDKHKRLGYGDNSKGFESQIKPHPWLKHIDWNLIAEKKLQPPYRPNVSSSITLRSKL